MYDYISGKLVNKNLDYVCIDINGLAYICHIPFKTYENLVDINDNEKLYVHLHIKEDAFTLYGFKTTDERKLFRLFISVSGIGPKIAIAILSVFTPSEIKNIILNEDYKFLSKVNGLGVKKAQKLIIEIKDKIDKTIEVSNDNNMFEINIVKNELLLALESLGYNKIKLEDYISNEEIIEIKDSGKLMKEILKKISNFK